MSINDVGSKVVHGDPSSCVDCGLVRSLENQIQWGDVLLSDENLNPGQYGWFEGVVVGNLQEAELL